MPHGAEPPTPCISARASTARSRRAVLSHPPKLTRDRRRVPSEPEFDLSHPVLLHPQHRDLLPLGEDRYRPDNGARLIVAIPPPSRNHRAPTADDTPARAAALTRRTARDRFPNRCRSSRPATDGRPGERIAGRGTRPNPLLRTPIATPPIELLRQPFESAQYTSHDYTQTLDDHRVQASIGSVGDAYDNALAESFVDTFKTELIRDRVWRTAANSNWRSSRSSRGSTPPPAPEPLAISHPTSTKPATASTLQFSPTTKEKKPPKPGLRETQLWLIGVADLVHRCDPLRRPRSLARLASDQDVGVVGSHCVSSRAAPYRLFDGVLAVDRVVTGTGIEGVSS